MNANRGTMRALAISLALNSAAVIKAAEPISEEGRDVFRPQVSICFDSNYISIEDRISSADIIADALTYLCSNSIGGTASNMNESELVKMARKRPALEAARKIFIVMILRKRSKYEKFPVTNK